VFIALHAAPLRILHTNDSHAAYEVGRNGLGGYLALEYHLNQARGEKQPALYLDAGDMQTGSIFSSMDYQGLRGGAVLEVFGMLALDAATLGNHEFDVSYDHAKTLVERAPFPFLSANIYDSDGSSFGRSEYAIFERGELKIGVIGLTIASLSERVKAENVKDLSILPYKEAVDRILPMVDAKCDLLILLTHNGWEADSLLATQLDNRVDLIIGGHSHVATPEPVQVNGIYLLSAGSHLQVLGIADLEVEDDRITKFSNRLLPLSAAPRDYYSSLKDFLRDSIGALETALSKTAGYLPYPFEVDKFKVTRGSQWVADAILTEYPVAELSFINNGGLRKHLPEGKVTLRDLHEYIPFGNTVAYFDCSGQDILTALAINRKNAIDRPYDIMSSSVKGWADTPVEISQLSIAGKPLELNKTYHVVTHDYIISQWDKYLGFMPMNAYDSGDLFLDAILRQVQKQLNED
jgi:2',3'-cyclic-nucleotide 2'-phosphodiesterase (5'-nucleotidase family)